MLKLAVLLGAVAVAGASTIMTLDPAWLAGQQRVTMEPDMAVLRATKHWTMGERAEAGETMTVHVMMKHSERAVAALEATLYAVSDPDSPRYGQHLSLDELAELTPISDAAVAAVTRFFDAEGVASVEANPNRDIFEVRLTVAAAEALFETEVHRFAHATRKGAAVLRAASAYTLPAALADVVSVVGDLVSLPAVRSTISVPTEVSLRGVRDGGSWPQGCTGLGGGLGGGCANKVTPAVINAAYKVSNATATPKNSMSVAEFQGQFFEKADLAKFSKGCGINVEVDTVVGGDQNSGGVEAELDIEYIKAISPEIPLTVVYSNQFSLLNWMTGVSKMASPPLVNSVSYGNDEKQQTSAAYMLSCNVQFMKAGARGISVLFASGDQGVCGREGCGIFRKRFKPDFPGGSPYITAVGATNFATAGVVGEETAWNGSGGGFSDTFAIPDWQAAAVSAYKSANKANLPPQRMWNNTGRGYPDVAALGGQTNPYCIVSSGMTSGVAGTSAACPVVASIFAKLNGVRLAAGKAPLGFLNPFIYKNGPTGFNDVTTGKNTGGGLLNRQGFSAAKGWDPATGWGSPNFEALSKAL